MRKIEDKKSRVVTGKEPKGEGEDSNRKKEEKLLYPYYQYNNGEKI